MFKELRSKLFNRNNEERSWNFSSLFETGYNTDTKKEITYYSCVNIISNSIAKCNLQLKKENNLGETVDKQHYLYDILRLRFNKNMTAYDTIKILIENAINDGIAGLYINRDEKGKIEGLYPAKIQNIIIDDAGLIKSEKNNKILYEFTSDTDNTIYSCFEKDIILLKHNTRDGINSTSIRHILNENLDTSLKSQNYLNRLFSNSLTNKLAIQLSSDIKDTKEIKKLQEKFDKIYTSNGKIFTIPAGFSVSSLETKLADAQFEELRRLSKEEIAGALGVPLSKLSLNKENGKSEEQDNLRFYTDTLLSYFTQLEQEFDYKLLTESERKRGYKIRFNTNVILRVDALTQCKIVCEYVKNGVYSLNTAKRILGIEQLEKDVTLFPSGQVTLEMLQNNNVSYTKDT